MKVIIEIESDDDLRRVREVFGEERIEVRHGGDGASAPPFDPERRREELRRAFGRFRGTIPPDYTFDRDELHARHA